jgi:putative hemolysin
MMHSRAAPHWRRCRDNVTADAAVPRRPVSAGHEPGGRELTVGDPGIWIALLAALSGCYFAACNIALKSFSRSRLSELLEQRQQPDRFDAFMPRVPRLMLMTGMIRTGLSLVVLLAMLWVVEGQTTHLGWHRGWQYLIALISAGLIVSIFAVALPLSWARYHGESLLARSIPLLHTLLTLFTPIVGALAALDPIVRRMSGADQHRNGVEISDEVLSVVEEHEDNGKVDESQRQMIEAVFDFSSTTAGEIMTPRTDVIGLELGASQEQIRQVVLEHGHSRIPVYEESLDHIVGILYAKDLIGYLGSSEPVNLRKVLRDVLMVPESKSVRDLLSDFKARKVHIAIVLDEYGGTAGLVTIEDIIEELVGDIQDEYEQAEEEPGLRKIDEKTADVDARMHIDDLNDELGIELPEDEDYDTVGGFVFSTLGHIPEVGERFEFEHVGFTVTDAERTKVKRVLVELLDQARAPDEPMGK